MAFVHLHTHSEYSLLDGANRIGDLVAHVRRLGMDSLAVTDHGNLHAAWTFYETARAQKLRPILGFEAYLAFGPRQEREKPSWAPANYSHLVLLARNREGYRNLVRLSSIGYTEGFYRRPRIDREVLERHSEGLVCLAACMSGEVALYLRQQKYDEAIAALRKQLEVNPMDGASHANIGRIFVQQKKYKEAVEELERAASMLPDVREDRFLPAARTGQRTCPAQHR